MCVGGSVATEVARGAVAKIAKGDLSGESKAEAIEPAPRTARMPDESVRRSALRAMLASGSGRGQATLLTGPGGVDPAQLNLGKTMLTGA